MFLFISQEEKLKCEVYLSEISQSAWQNRVQISLASGGGCSESSHRGRLCNVMQSVFPVMVQRGKGSFSSKYLHCLTPHTNLPHILLAFPVLFFLFLFPDNLTYSVAVLFKQGMTFRSCNISLTLKDQVSTLPADLHPVMLSLSIYNHGVGRASCMQRSHQLVYTIIFFPCRGE